MTPLGAELAGGERESTISIGVVRGLVEAVEQAGVARADFLRAARLEAAQLDAPEARILRKEVLRLCELAIDLTGDPALGLHWAERLTERMFVPISHLMAHCSSLRQAFELLAQFFRLLGDEVPYRIVERDKTVTVTCLNFEGESLRIQRFNAEMMVGGFWRLIRSFNHHARPDRACFGYAAPTHHTEYTRLFDGLQLFDQPFTGIVFDSALLNAPSPQKDDDVREALQALAERRLQRITHSTPYSQRVREHLVRHGWPHQTDMESVARSLEVSVRSLRRRLADEGKPYNEVLSEALAIVAKQQLSDPRRTIQEVAYEMGFSDPSAFHRAFKRWTGSTPSAFREALLKSSERE
jgi:AraC-like DNA-binding protein